MGDIPCQRLISQQLARPAFTSAADVVHWMGAVQAQDYAGAKWALGVRMAAATDNAIEAAFNAGAILRTHVMRPTWHFVTPADLGWLLDLTAPRINLGNAHRYRELELDAVVLKRGQAVIARALRGGRACTRAELRARLDAAGVRTDGQRLSHLLMYAELDGLVCSGPRRGTAHTYALLAERAPRSTRLAREAALAELARRYFAGHGPATIRDFVWWSGLTMADAKAGVEGAGQSLVREAIDGQPHYVSAAARAAASAGWAAWLLPAYDEYMVGYRDRGAALDPALVELASSQRQLGPVAVIDGQVVGNWKRAVRRGTVTVELDCARALTEAERQGLEDSARRYGQFLGLPAELA